MMLLFRYVVDHFPYGEIPSTFDVELFDFISFLL
jgi:hypothetical protein